MTGPGAHAGLAKWDAHCHLFEHGFAGRHALFADSGAELRVYQTFRAEHTVRRALVVGYEGEPHYAGNNDYVAGLARSHPWLLPLAWVEPRPPAPTALHALLDDGHLGLSVYVATPDAAAALACWPRPVLDVLTERRAVLSLNAAASCAAALAPWLDAVAPCPVLLSHLGLPGPPGDRSPTERLAPVLDLARFDNVLVKLSGQYAASARPHDYPHDDVRPLVDLLFQRFGAGRVCWGSDFSPSLESISLDQAVAPILPALSHDELALVFGQNLERALGPTLRSREETPIP